MMWKFIEVTIRRENNAFTSMEQLFCQVRSYLIADPSTGWRSPAAYGEDAVGYPYLPRCYSLNHWIELKSSTASLVWILCETTSMLDCADRSWGHSSRLWLSRTQRPREDWGRRAAGHPMLTRWIGTRPREVWWRRRGSRWQAWEWTFAGG